MEGEAIHVTVDMVLVRPWGVSWSASKQSGILVAPTTRALLSSYCCVWEVFYI